MSETGVNTGQEAPRADGATLMAAQGYRDETAHLEAEMGDRIDEARRVRGQSSGRGASVQN